MLENGEQKDWFASNMIKYLAVAAFLGLVLFAVRELTADKPAVNLRILKDINFTSGSLLGGLTGMGLFASIFLLPLFLQQVLGYPAYNSGLALIPRSLAMAVTMPLGGRLYNRVGPKILIIIGVFLNAVSFYQFSRLSLDMGYWEICIPQIIQGGGFGFMFVSLSTAVMSTIEKPLLAAASGLYNVTRQVFASIAIALAATFLTRGENWYRAVLTEHVTAFSDATSESMGRFSSFLASQGANASGADMEALKVLETTVTRQASMLAYNHVFFLIAVLLFLSLPLALLIRDKQRERSVEMITD